MLPVGRWRVASLGHLHPALLSWPCTVRSGTVSFIGFGAAFRMKMQRLTSNNSLQPTSPSSLRSSCAAAELHRYASEWEEVMGSRACSFIVGWRATLAWSVAANFTGAPRITCASSDAARAVPADGLVKHCEAASSTVSQGLVGRRVAAPLRWLSCRGLGVGPTLTHNKSLQPTSGSSLRSSPAAAELPR